MIDKKLLLEHLNVLYNNYKTNYTIDKSLTPVHTNVHKYRDAAAQVKQLIVQVNYTLSDNDEPIVNFDPPKRLA